MSPKERNKKKLELFSEILKILETLPTEVTVECFYNEAETPVKSIDTTIKINFISAKTTICELNGQKTS